MSNDLEASRQPASDVLQVVYATRVVQRRPTQHDAFDISAAIPIRIAQQDDIAQRTPQVVRVVSEPVTFRWYMACKT